MNTVNNISFGRRKIPRYIYHFTNQKNYYSMLNDGVIKAGFNDGFLKGKGVFTIALQDFLKHWGFSKSWQDEYYPETLRTSLLRKVASWVASIEDENALVVLKIPTCKLDKAKLKIRSQNRFFKFMKSEQIINCAPYALREHLEGETLANESKKFNNRGEALEYIYQENIPINYVEQVGQTVDIYQLRQNLKTKISEGKSLSSEEITLEALKQVFKNTAEEKGLFLINKKI